MKDKLALVIVLLTLVGIVLSGVSLYNHYKSTPTDYCDLGDNFNCDIVNRSIYAQVGKMPVAAIGLVGYIVLMVLALQRRDESNRFHFASAGRARRRWILALPHLHRKVCAGDVVHHLPGFAGDHLADLPARRWRDISANRRQPADLAADQRRSTLITS